MHTTANVDGRHLKSSARICIAKTLKDLTYLAAQQHHSDSPDGLLHAVTAQKHVDMLARSCQIEMNQEYANA